jgi:hypothetical protein
MHVGTHLRVQPSTCFLLLPAIKLLSAGAAVSPAASNAQPQATSNKTLQ